MPDNSTPADYALDVEEALAVADRIGDLDQPLPDRDLCQRAALGLATAVRSLRTRNERLGLLRVEAESELERLQGPATEFVKAVDCAREQGVPPMLGPVLTPFMQLRAVTGVGLSNDTGDGGNR